MFKFRTIKGLMTTDNIGSVWTYALNLAKELRKHNFEITLAITGDKLTEAQILELEDINWYFQPFKQEWMENPWEDIKKCGEWLMEILEEVNPDFIHLNSCSLGSLNWKRPVVVTLHSCVVSWWEAVKKEKIPREWFRYKGNVENGIRSADMVVAPSRTMMNYAEKNYGKLPNKKVIYNGGCRQNYQTDIKEKYIFSMGRIWDEAKNIDEIVKAAPLIPYNIYIAGNNQGYITADLPANVRFIGYLSPTEIINWLSSASVYLLPVKYEPFGYTFLEAAFSGCALVTGDIDSMREIWDDAAIYTDTSDPLKLAEQVNALMYDDDLRAGMAEKARKRAETNYTLEKMAEEYVALYRQIKN